MAERPVPGASGHPLSAGTLRARQPLRVVPRVLGPGGCPSFPGGDGQGCPARSHALRGGLCLPCPGSSLRTRGYLQPALRLKCFLLRIRKVSCEGGSCASPPPRMAVRRRISPRSSVLSLRCPPRTLPQTPWPGLRWPALQLSQGLLSWSCILVAAILVFPPASDPSSVWCLPGCQVSPLKTGKKRQEGSSEKAFKTAMFLLWEQEVFDTVAARNSQTPELTADLGEFFFISQSLMTRCFQVRCAGLPSVGWC